MKKRKSPARGDDVFFRPVGVEGVRVGKPVLAYTWRRVHSRRPFFFFSFSKPLFFLEAYKPAASTPRRAFGRRRFVWVLRESGWLARVLMVRAHGVEVTFPLLAEVYATRVVFSRVFNVLLLFLVVVAVFACFVFIVFVGV